MYAWHPQSTPEAFYGWFVITCLLFLLSFVKACEYGMFIKLVVRGLFVFQVFIIIRQLLGG